MYITVETFKRLQPGIWLNDEIINFIMLHLFHKMPDFIFLNSFFCANFYLDQVLPENKDISISSKCVETGFNRCQSWLRNKDIKCFATSIFIFPIHLSNNHWTLGNISVFSET